MSESTVQSASLPGPLERLAETLTSHQKCVLLAGFAFQVIVLLTMIGQRAWVHVSGETYYVRVQPVDPRDLFRGDYVTLGYDFSRVPHELVSQQPGDARSIYVTLVPAGDGKHSIAGQYLLHAPADGTPYLKGRVDASGRAEYGIESFFVQEGKGRAYEEAVRSRRLTAEIVVTRDGKAALRQLHIMQK
jgi:uncharacterized membrane-anchored protein